MKLLFGSTTGLICLVFLGVFFGLQNTSIREILLYQEYFPIQENTKKLEAGDLIVVDLITNKFSELSAETCISEVRVPIKNRDFTVSIRGNISDSGGKNKNQRGLSSVQFSMTAVNPIDRLNSAFIANPVCEEQVREKIENKCLLVIVSTVNLNGNRVGFDTSERCQLINTTEKPVALDSLATAKSFNSVFGVSFFQDIWITLTFPLVGMEISE